MSWYFLTRLNVGDYDAWKPMFDEDGPGARAAASGHRILRNAENPGEIFVMVEFATEADARTGRERLLSSGILDRFPDKDLPRILEQTESKTR